MNTNFKKQYRKSFLVASLFTTILICSSPLTSWGQNGANSSKNEKPAKEVFSNPVPEKPEDISPLLIGETIPTVNLPDASGKSFNLNKAVAESPTILIFYRGGWCPYCSRQLSGMQEIEQDLKSLGYKVIAVSTDSPENLTETLGKEKLSYTLLSDSELTVAKKFGIAFKGPKAYDKLLPEASGGKNVDKLLPVPSVFILDTKGVIQFEYINPNYAARISPALLKAVATTLADELKAKKQ
jgi:peroxiredoxin